MFKKILYGIVVIGIIIIISILWTKGDTKDDTTPIVPIASAPVQEEVVTPPEPTISEQIDGVNVDSGIDTDLIGVDTDIKTL